MSTDQITPKLNRAVLMAEFLNDYLKANPKK